MRQAVEPAPSGAVSGEEEDSTYNGQSQTAAFQVAHGEAPDTSEPRPRDARCVSTVSRAETLPSGLSELRVLPRPSGTRGQGRVGSQAEQVGLTGAAGQNDHTAPLPAGAHEQGDRRQDAERRPRRGLPSDVRRLRRHRRQPGRRTPNTDPHPIRPWLHRRREPDRRGGRARSGPGRARATARPPARFRTHGS